MSYSFINSATSSGVASPKPTRPPPQIQSAGAPYIEKTAEEFGIKKDENGILALGKSAHGSTPHLGVNAIEKAVGYLTKIRLLDGRIDEYLFKDKLGLKNISDETGNLTFSPNKIGIENGLIAVTVDIRYPSTKKKEEILSLLDKIGDYKVLSHQNPLYNDINGKLITTLLKVYNEETGKTATPIAIGGGTYARALKFGVGFGPETDDENFMIHQPNEYVSIKNLKMQFKIYKRAIEELTR